MQIYAKPCIWHATEKYINMYWLAHAYILSEKISRNGKMLPPGEELEIRRQAELEGHWNCSLPLLNDVPFTGITCR